MRVSRPRNDAKPGPPRTLAVAPVKMTVPRPRSYHSPGRFPASQETGKGSAFPYLTVYLGGHIKNRTAVLGAAIEHERFHGPDFVFDLIEQIDHRFLIARIARNSLRQAAIVFDFRNQFAERHYLAARRDSDQSLTGKPPRNCATKSVTRSHNHQLYRASRRQNGITMPPIGASQFKRLTRFRLILKLSPAGSSV